MRNKFVHVVFTTRPLIREKRRNSCHHECETLKHFLWQRNWNWNRSCCVQMALLQLQLNVKQFLIWHLIEAVQGDGRRCVMQVLNDPIVMLKFFFFFWKWQILVIHSNKNKETVLTFTQLFLLKTLCLFALVKIIAKNFWKWWNKMFNVIFSWQQLNLLRQLWGFEFVLLSNFK